MSFVIIAIPKGAPNIIFQILSKRSLPVTNEEASISEKLYFLVLFLDPDVFLLIL